MSTYDLSQAIKQFEILSDDENHRSCYWGIKIPENKMSNIKKICDIHSHYVFFLIDNTVFGSAKNFFITTDKGIFYRYDEDPIFISWDFIDDLCYSDENKEIYVEYNAKLASLSFIVTFELPEKFLEIIGNLITAKKSPLSELYDYFYKKLPKTSDVLLMDFEGINSDIRNNNTKKYLREMCDKLIEFSDSKLSSIEIKYSIQLEKSLILRMADFIHAYACYLMGEIKQANEYFILVRDRLKEEIEELESDIEISKSDPEFSEFLEEEQTRIEECEKYLALTLEFLGKISYFQRDYKDALYFLSEAKDIKRVKGDQKRRIRDCIEKYQNQLNDSLRVNSINENTRQVILCIQKTISKTTKELLFCTVSTIKSMNWKFPIGHPIENTIYICHPLCTDKYLPIEDFHLKMFDDKYSELVYLLESLGANYVHVEVISGVSKSVLSTEKQDAGASIEIGNMSSMGFSGKRGTNIEDRKSEQVQYTSSWDIILTPRGVPYIPKDLAWFHHEPIWQRLSQSCLKGSCKEFTIELNQREDFSINSKKIYQIESEIDFFLKMVGGSVKILNREGVEENIKKIKNTSWKVVAKFSDLSENSKVDGFNTSTSDKKIEENIISLIRGQRLKLAQILPNSKDFQIFIDINSPRLVIDFACFCLDLNKKLSDEKYMTFFNQTCTPCGGVNIDKIAENNISFRIILKKLPTSIHQLVFTAAIDGNATMSQLELFINKAQ